MEKKRYKYKLTSFQVIIMSFLVLIALGTFLLMMPAATRGSGHATFMEAFFTATSASCVTGLIVQDTATYWSGFGHAVILLLIQIGGMGVITVASLIAVIAGRQAGIMHRSILQESVSAPTAGGIMRHLGFIVAMTFITEGLGAVLLYPTFAEEFGPLRGLWYAVFHSVSAFCNAGFDLMGAKQAYSSLTSYSMNLHVNLVIMLLITVGGIGFLTWSDIRRNGFRFRRYMLQTKIILITSAVLTFGGALYFWIFEYADLPAGERFLGGLFTSVTARTAGFNTTDLTTLSIPGQIAMIGLMLIGGSPGSTAGGMKTTTFAVLFASAMSVFRRQKNASLHKRRISYETTRNAAAILMLYVVLFITAASIICRRDGFEFSQCLFETASAIGTVGVTQGITPALGGFSRLLIIGLMFFGRVGGLTLIYASLIKRDDITEHLPEENVTVG